jgi:hypothetical protein
MYALQSLQSGLPAIKESNTNELSVWKQIAVCEELEQLKAHVKNTSRRIVNQDNLEVVYSFQRYHS